MRSTSIWSTTDAGTKAWRDTRDSRREASSVSSFGKTYHVTGWKIAYCLAPRELTAEFRKAHQFVVFCVHTPSQLALAEFLARKEWYAELAAFYQGQRNFFRDALARFPTGVAPMR